MVKKRGNIPETLSESRPIILDEAAEKNDLRSNLAEIRKHDGIIGYILKDANNAVVDLNEPAKISDYAILSSATTETASELSSLFALGEIKKIVVEAEQAKMLLINVGENKISVFMERNADVEDVHERLK